MTKNTAQNVAARRLKRMVGEMVCKDIFVQIVPSHFNPQVETSSAHGRKLTPGMNTRSIVER